MVMDCFCPQILWESCCFHHHSSTFHMCSVCSFSSTIGCWGVMNCQVVNCFCVLEVFGELFASEFATLITTKNTYQCIPLDLNPSLILLVLSKGLGLLSQEGNNLLMAMKILEECVVSLPPMDWTEAGPQMLDTTSLL